MIVDDSPTRKAQEIIAALSQGECPNEVRAICNIVLSIYDNDMERAREGGLSNEMVRQINSRTGLGASTIRDVFEKVRNQLEDYCSVAETQSLEPECVGGAKIFLGQMCALSSLDHIELQQEIRVLKSRAGVCELDEISLLLSKVLDKAEKPEDPTYPGRRVDCSEIYITQSTKRLIRLMAIDEVLSKHSNGDLGYRGGMRFDALQYEVNKVISKRYGNIIEAGEAQIINNDFVAIRAMFATDFSRLPHGRDVFLMRGRKFSYTRECMSAFFITLSSKEASIIAGDLDKYSDIILERRYGRDTFPLLKVLYLYGKNKQNQIRKDKMGIVDYYSNSYAVMNMAIKYKQTVTIEFYDGSRRSYRPKELKDCGDGWSVIVEDFSGEEEEIPCSRMLTISLSS